MKYELKLIKEYFYLKNYYSFLINNFVLSFSTISLNCLSLLHGHTGEKNQNKEKPEYKNHRMSFHRLKIEADHKKKNEILNIFIRAIQKNIRFVAFS